MRRSGDLIKNQARFFWKLNTLLEVEAEAMEDLPVCYQIPEDWF
jgi:hypothetical protein